MKKILFVILWVFALGLCADAAGKIELRGRVLLRDSAASHGAAQGTSEGTAEGVSEGSAAAAPAVSAAEVHSVSVHADEAEARGGDFVMVYVKELGVGTLSDENGQYSISVPASVGQVLHLEYSRMGYAAELRSVTLNGASIDLPDIYMDVQALMLAAAYITPDGKNPADVVLDKLWERSRQIQKAPFDYTAYIDYSVATHELPLVTEALPKIAMGAFKIVGAAQGYGPLIRYCTKNDDFRAKACLTRQVKNGVRNDFSKKLLSSDRALPSNVTQSLLNLMDIIDLFEILYGAPADFADKWSGKHKFTLTGTYEYGDKLVDVLQHSDRHGRSTITVHVVEEDWAILKLQLFTKEGEVLRCEARQLQNGVYMPLSMVMKPAVTMIRAHQIPKLMEMVRKSRDLGKAAKERLLRALEEHQGRDLNPYIAVSGNVRYSL